MEGGKDDIAPVRTVKQINVKLNQVSSLFRTMILVATVSINLIGQWFIKKLTDAASDDNDTDLTDITLMDVVSTDTNETDTSDSLPDLSDCEDCNPVTLEDLISRPGEIIDISDDHPHPFYNNDPDHEDYDHNHEEYNHYEEEHDYHRNLDTSDYDSEDNEAFPSIWHEIAHALMELERVGGLRIRRRH